MTEEVCSINCNSNIGVDLKHCVLSCRLPDAENSIFQSIAGDVLVRKMNKVTGHSMLCLHLL